MSNVNARMCARLRRSDESASDGGMQSHSRVGQVAVIFTAQRTADDADGYQAAATAMAALAERQPGYAGMTSARGEDGVGITVSYWTDDAAAKAWRDHPEHARIRGLGRERWYEWYELAVTRIERDYGWRRA